jgi:two-component system, cell cycle response regulator CtrA
MTLRDELVAKLEEENDALRARVRMLEELSGVGFESPPEFQLTRNESIIFGMLLKNQLVRRTAVMDALYMHEQDEAEIKIVDVWICKIRKKMKPYDITISLQRGQGYFMPPASKAIALAMIDQTRAA